MEFDRGLHWSNDVVDIGSVPRDVKYDPIDWTERENSP